MAERLIEIPGINTNMVPRHSILSKEFNNNYMRLMRPPVGVDTEAGKDVFYFDLTQNVTTEEKPRKARDKKEKGEKPGDGWTWMLNPE